MWWRGPRGGGTKAQGSPRRGLKGARGEGSREEGVGEPVVNVALVSVQQWSVIKQKPGHLPQDARVPPKETSRPGASFLPAVHGKTREARWVKKETFPFLIERKMQKSRNLLGLKIKRFLIPGFSRRQRNLQWKNWPPGKDRAQAGNGRAFATPQRHLTRCLLLPATSLLLFGSKFVLRRLI